ncbi:Threonylcarbamoyl-AMP synthase [Bienertia sinuspersici]
MAKGDLYALDFDGILCDSCGESSLSALKASKVRWPTLFNGVDSVTEDWIVDQMHIVAEGLTIGNILENWSKLKPVIMEEWDEKDNREALIDLFGRLEMNGLRMIWQHGLVQIARFADALLRELAGVTIPPERIYGLGTGPKVEVLKKLQKQPEHQGLALHFVEDRLATLKNVTGAITPEKKGKKQRLFQESKCLSCLNSVRS